MFSFRLHEFDEQVAAVREGMARVVPVPLLSLFTGYELETMVCPPFLCASLQRPSRGNPLNQHHQLTSQLNLTLGGLRSAHAF